MRGSIGYGLEFQEKIFKSVGGIEVDDVESAVRYLKTLPYVDADRFGIHGGSYGGLVTLMAVFKKPTLFKAAVAQCPATNLWHGPGLRFARTPQENPDAYKNGSPISFGEDLQARLLIMHGTQDTNVLFQDTLKLAEKLVTLGKNFDMVIVPSAGHCAGPNVNQSWFTTTKLVEHFDRFLGRGPGAPDGPGR
jgi:dipeptidyl-peptidase-4